MRRALCWKIVFGRNFVGILNATDVLISEGLHYVPVGN